MKDLLIRPLIRLRMALTSRESASRQIRRTLLEYRGLCAGLGEEEARRPTQVPAMLGVDPEMRSWSIFQILEHNVIVNRSITGIVQSLARTSQGSRCEAPPNGLVGEAPAVIDPKRDVLPSVNPGPEQLALFRESVEHHLAVVPELPRLRGTSRHPHPVFGRLDAHGWHCMFGLHLQIHLWQAEAVVRALSSPGEIRG
jgi:hypothetical protein